LARYGFANIAGKTARFPTYRDLDGFDCASREIKQLSYIKASLRLSRREQCCVRRRSPALLQNFAGTVSNPAPNNCADR
jgi:hypothetical protein